MELTLELDCQARTGKKKDNHFYQSGYLWVSFFSFLIFSPFFSILMVKFSLSYSF